MLSLRRPIAPRFFLTQVRGRRLASPAERRRKHVTLDAPVSVNSEESPVLRWLMTDGRRTTDPKSFLENFAMCLTEAGVDVSRVTTGVPVLHPQLYSYSGLWERGKGVTERLYRADASQDAILTNSPIKSAYEGSPFRSRLTAPAMEGEFPILTELRRTGMTDYVVLPVPFSDGTNKALSLATARDGGFPDGELTLFTAMTPAVASILEIQALRRMARTLLDTYVGRQSGGRVLAGQIRRGMGETIRAVIWLSDLRGFTSLSESPPRDELIELLNQYFGPMCDAVEANGGEVLKFIGDAMLAIFPVEDDAVAAGRKALGAVRVAEGTVNKGTNGAPRMASRESTMAWRCTSAMSCTAIGGEARLDFTVIGPAVNLTSRIESMCKDLDRSPLLSAEFARLSGVEAECLGEFELKGVAEKQLIYGLRE
jgi:adenylate cyclase